MTDYLQQEIDRLNQKINEAQEALTDPQLKSLAEEEIASLKQALQALVESQNSSPALPLRSGNEPQGNVILEIRPGTGGEEAKLWAEDLENMYVRFANLQKLTVVKIDSGVIKIKNKTAYALFKHEAGVHRVQRVPTTEAQGRIHTSTATVAVLPDVKETDINVNPKDLEIAFFHASSHGGQNVQKVSTAVRITHKPTGLITSCQTQRFQDQNRKIAIDMLRSKLFQIEQEKNLAETGAARQLAGHGSRAEKIRTYNFPQNRVTDHRLGKSWKSLDRIMAGDLLPLLTALQVLPKLPLN